MFYDLVGSTALSAQLDPEELREVVREYQETCTAVIRRYEGHIAQHLGDGLLVYFEYSTAHEDDAARAVRTGLESLEALRLQVPSPVQGEGQGEGAVGATGRSPLQSLDIPSTLQDSLMARLDRLGPAKEIAQLGATLRREFNYELLKAVSPLSEEILQQGLKQCPYFSAWP